MAGRKESRVLVAEKLHDPNNSEVYEYRSDGQLATFARGTLDDTKTYVETLTTISGVLQEQNWTLDGMGNWSTTSNTIGGVMTTDARDHSNYNEIDERTVTTGTMSTGGSITYDQNGNMKDDGIRFYKWDAFNRLRYVYRKSDGMLISSFGYDAAGRRFEMTVYNGGINGTSTNGTTDYFYDGQRVIEERDGNDDVTQQYVYGNYLDEVWTLDNRRGGIPVADLNDGTGNERHFYHYDRLYSVYGLTTEEADLVEAYMYEPFGKQIVIVNSTLGDPVTFSSMSDVWTVGGASNFNNVNMFTGQRFDEATGLDYYKARYYDVELGRFISRDPVEDDRNLYRYVLNNPIGATDPSGNRLIIDVPKGWKVIKRPTEVSEKVVAEQRQSDIVPGQGRFFWTRQDVLVYDWVQHPFISAPVQTTQKGEPLEGSFTLSFGEIKTKAFTVTVGGTAENVTVSGAYQISKGTIATGASSKGFKEPGVKGKDLMAIGVVQRVQWIRRDVGTPPPGKIFAEPRVVATWYTTLTNVILESE